MERLIHPDQVAAGLALREMFSKLIGHSLVGMSTYDVQDIVCMYLAQSGASPACQGYNNYPEHICVSVDDEACHGVPSPKKLITSESVVKVDVVARVGDQHADSCVTLYAGDDSTIRDDILSSYLVFSAAVSKVMPGVRVSAISRFIDKAARRVGMRAIRTFSGHGIGEKIHQEPWVHNFYDPRVKDHTLMPGDIITIEPILTRGSGLVVFDEDGWTARTKDKANCYMFEHTVAVTEIGRRVLT